MNYCKRGSEWRRWDLHIHSPKVFLNNQYHDCSISDFVDHIVKANIAAVGLTNYFKFDQAELQEIKRSINEKNIIVFPNLEFRTQPPNKENEEMHIHVLFSDKVSIKDIFGFLGRLKTIDNKYCIDLTASEISNTSVSLDTLRDTLRNEVNIKHMEDYLIIACPRGQGNFRPSQSDDGRGMTLAEEVDKYSDVLFGNANDTEYFLNESRYSGAKPKPVLLCSDAHMLTDIGTKYTWIKSDPTFEGLKQIIYDPKSRVAIQDNKPIQPNNVIEKILFNIPLDATIDVKQPNESEKTEMFCFAGEISSFCLSPYFNCFIGGRGSGKSTILNFLGQHSKDPHSSQQFWEKIQPSFRTTDTSLFTFEGATLFEFIGQSEVETFASDKELFTDAIYERSNILSENELENTRNRLTMLLEKTNLFRPKIETIEQLIKEKESKEKEKKTLENVIRMSENKEYDEIVSDITECSNKKQTLERWRVTIEELRRYFNELNTRLFLTESSIELGRKKSAENQEENIISIKYQHAYENVKKQIEIAIEELNIEKFIELINEEDDLVIKINEHEKRLSEFLERAGLTQENILQIKSAPQAIVKINDELDHLRKKIEEHEKDASEYDSVIAELGKVKSHYEKLIRKWIAPLTEKLEQQLQENNQNDIKKIGLNYFFDDLEAWNQIVKQSYSYFLEKYGMGERQDHLRNYIIDNRSIFEKDQETILGLLAKEDKKTGYLDFLKKMFENESSYKIFQIIRDVNLHDVSNHKRIQVIYDGKDIERASFGQKCTAVIVILLLFGNYPLIIDEPEAHLDSSLIANYLVPLIKRQKTNRQILFATHNANFVINGDSEKIFILKNETGKTQVVETTIENLVNRNELLKLEGGRDAFKKRGEKLHI